MKRFLSLAIVFVLAIGSLAGCGSSNGTATTGSSASEAVSSAASTTAEQTAAATTSDSGSAAGKTFAMIGRSTGNPYVQKEMDGFNDAVKEFGGNPIIEAPDQATADAQISMVNQLVAQKVATIAIASNDANALQPVLKKAMTAGVKVLSHDSAASPEGRMVHVNQADSVAIGKVEVQAIAKMIDYKGEIAILSATSTSDNQNTWIQYMKEELKDAKYKDITLVKIAYGDDQPDKSVSETQALLKTFPNLKGIIAPTTVGMAAAGKVLTDKGLSGKVFLTGLGLPSEMAAYIKNGVCPYMFLWNPIDIGYLAAYTSKALEDGTITGKEGDTFTAGKLGQYKVTKAPDGGTEVLLGPPFKFDSSNIDEWSKVY